MGGRQGTANAHVAHRQVHSAVQLGRRGVHLATTGIAYCHFSAFTEQTDATVEGYGLGWEGSIAALKANLKKIPEWAQDEDTYKLGKTMEKRVQKWTIQILQDSKSELGETIDLYLENNKDTVAKFAEDTDDEDAVRILSDGLQAAVVRFMDETEITNEGTLADQSHKALLKLQHANDYLEALSAKDLKDLDHFDRQLRLAIALMMEGTENIEVPDIELPDSLKLPDNGTK